MSTAVMKASAARQWRWRHSNDEASPPSRVTLPLVLPLSAAALAPSPSDSTAAAAPSPAVPLVPFSSPCPLSLSLFSVPHSSSLFSLFFPFLLLYVWEARVRDMSVSALVRLRVSEASLCVYIWEEEGSG
ncbi:hypothetical protein AAHE18_17G115000 [Arachis hypogaea]|nr:uncharacterized protein DS421_17g582490 [Arachis hypogaea]